jgi:hypothetical protein
VHNNDALCSLEGQTHLVINLILNPVLDRGRRGLEFLCYWLVQSGVDLTVDSVVDFSWWCVRTGGDGVLVVYAVNGYGVFGLIELPDLGYARNVRIGEGRHPDPCRHGRLGIDCFFDRFRESVRHDQAASTTDRICYVVQLERCNSSIAFAAWRSSQFWSDRSLSQRKGRG